MTQPAYPRVLIIDSSSVLRRCFDGYKYALQPSQWNGRVVDTSGVRGYMSYIQRLYSEFDFEAMVHVLDPPGGSFDRYAMYPAYKANRPEFDDPVLAAQKALLPVALRAFGERLIIKRGFESDDVIGTLARQLADEGSQVLIITPDKDLLQLVEDGRISVARYVVDPNSTYKSKVHDMYYEAEVKAKMGVEPRLVADLLAMVGDASDNIPGISGVGEKKAVALLEKYGDLLSVMTHAAEIPGKLGENVRHALPMLPTYQKLTSCLVVPDLSVPERPMAKPEDIEAIAAALNWPTDAPMRLKSYAEVEAEMSAASTEVNETHIERRIDMEQAPAYVAQAVTGPQAETSTLTSESSAPSSTGPVVKPGRPRLG